MPKANSVTVRYADGRVEVRRAGYFAKNFRQRRGTPSWRQVRKKVLRRDGYRCTHCGATREKAILEVHHLTYERLGRERLEDLKTMCQRCHAAEHEWLKRLGRPLTRRTAR